MLARDRWQHGAAGRRLKGAVKLPAGLQGSPGSLKITRVLANLPASALTCLLQVKADRNNKKLYTLQQASRHVNDMAAVVVSSTKHGQQQISDSGKRGEWAEFAWVLSGFSRFHSQSRNMHVSVNSCFSLFVSR